MSDLADTAHRLRQVKNATRQFLALYALETARERVRDQAHAAPSTQAAALESAVCDYNNHDWSLLYRGSVLDD
jgi:hypothetical protein